MEWSRQCRRRRRGAGLGAERHLQLQGGDEDGEMRTVTTAVTARASCQRSSPPRCSTRARGARRRRRRRATPRGCRCGSCASRGRQLSVIREHGHAGDLREELPGEPRGGARHPQGFVGSAVLCTRSSTWHSTAARTSSRWSFSSRGCGSPRRVVGCRWDMRVAHFSPLQLSGLLCGIT